MSTQTPEEKFRALIEDLGKPTMRGVRRCPKCGTLNGTRGISCKNKSCDVVFKEREKKKGHSADAVKIITGSTVQVYSVRLRDRGPDYRGFVQLPLVQDMDGNAPEHVDPVVLETAAKCYVDTCARGSRGGPSSHQTSCPHIKSAIGCMEEAIPLTLKNSVLNSLNVSPEIKQDIWLLATETSGPLVQRVTKNIMVVKCKAYNKHPLGFLHFSFFETARNRSQPEYKFQCSCRIFKLKLCQSKDDGPKRCVHFYACICAFASDELLAEEFAYYINLDEFSCTSPVDLMVTINSTLPDASDLISSDMITAETEEVTTLPVTSDEQLVKMEALAMRGDEDVTVSQSHDGADLVSETNVEVIVSEETILALQAKRLKSEVDLLMEGDPLEQASSALLNLQEKSLPIATSIAVSTALPTTITTMAQPQPPLPTKKPATPKSTPAKTVPTPKKACIEEAGVELTFHQWLASVTERINQTMHYQFDGYPDPLVFHSPQKFFDCIQQRISAGSKKKRLPNFTTGFIRKDALPLGSFIKYTWYITSIFHVKQIFDTPMMPLEITQCFVENRDGTYDFYEPPKMPEAASTGGKTPIRPFELKTYLRVGMTSPDQKDPTPFVIEWIPDILPKSHIGELRIKFEYGHQRNGQIEHRAVQAAPSNQMEMIQIQPAV